MKRLFLIAALAALAACGGQQSRATFTCPNGPDLAIDYSDEGARIYFPDGRVELLPPAGPEHPNVYAKPGLAWQATRFRTGRLTDGQSSYLCDQMAG